MKRLRHPIRAIREPFGTAGLIVAMIALVAALGGTALAASKLNSTQKKEVEKIAKKYAGTSGANGTNGTNGAPGAKGDAGATGGAGAAGPTGPTGPRGLAGPEGNVKATLASGKTETGTWAAVEGGVNAISFPIPLETGFIGGGAEEESCTAAGATQCHAHFILHNGEEQLDALTKVEHPTECHGNVAEPTADPGNLCIYVLRLNGSASSNSIFNTPKSLGPESEEGATGKAGAILLMSNSPGAQSYGTWAVTAP